MSKLGDILNKDVGTIAKGAGKVLSNDLGELLTENGAQPKADEAAALVDNIRGTETQPNSALGHSSAQPKDGLAAAAPSAPSAEPGSTGTFIPVESAVQPALPTQPAKARLTEALVNRQRLAEPIGADLLLLLPLKLGNYERTRGVAQGEIASDPVNVTYSGNGEAVSVTIVSCWDADEALEKLERNRAKLENSRGSHQLNWVAGIDARGVVFLWVRSNYFFEVVSPRGVSPIARFLGDFPY
jgi:hypothetical protein